jgi:hypothetical protein
LEIIRDFRNFNGDFVWKIQLIEAGILVVGEIQIGNKTTSVAKYPI